MTPVRLRAASPAFMGFAAVLTVAFSFALAAVFDSRPAARADMREPPAFASAR
jgi:hypothetical protein